MQNNEKIEFTGDELEDYVNNATETSIGSLEEFKKIYSSIEELYSQAKKFITFETLDKIEKNMSEEFKQELLEKTDDREYALIKAYIKLMEFGKMDEGHKLQNLSSDNSISDELCDLIDTDENAIFLNDFMKEALSSLYRNKQNFQPLDAFEVLTTFREVAKYVIENDIDFENLHIDLVLYPYNSAYRLYNTLPAGTNEHVASIHIRDDGSSFLLRPAEEKDREEIKDWFNGIAEDKLIEIDDENRVAFAQTENGVKTLLGLDDSYYQDAEKEINIKSLGEIEQSKITPTNIEELSINMGSNNEELQDVIDELTNQKGYGELSKQI